MQDAWESLDDDGSGELTEKEFDEAHTDQCPMGRSYMVYLSLKEVPMSLLMDLRICYTGTWTHWYVPFLRASHFCSVVLNSGGCKGSWRALLVANIVG